MSIILHRDGLHELHRGAAGGEQVTIADAILERFMQQHHRFTLTGDSLRQAPKPPKMEEKADQS